MYRSGSLAHKQQLKGRFTAAGAGDLRRAASVMDVMWYQPACVRCFRGR